ncbi:MAG: D-ribose pyranase [Elusimicrobiota bacterium]|jgi:D-ribose pyranase|nr:D-ribose pyranase [Elusimicrobiota bacterium]
MKKTFLLNSQISFAISSLGHTQSICIADCGLPIPQNVERIDIALSKGIPSFLDTLEAVLSEMQVEKALMATELKDNKNFTQKIIDLLKYSNEKIIIDFIPHADFKRETQNSAAIIRTGEQTPYANVLLFSGVTF